MSQIDNDGVIDRQVLEDGNFTFHLIFAGTMFLKLGHSGPGGV